MKTFLVSFLLLFTSISHAQNWPACDSIIIDCCTYNIVAPNTVTIYVSNSSSELFSYPGFVLLNLNMDTIAQETVNYFGIGTGPQPHTMNIIAPLILPFSGYLQLYTLFGDTLSCQFPILIPDTTTGIVLHNEAPVYSLFPNPIMENKTLHLKLHQSANQTQLKISDTSGRIVMNSESDYIADETISIDTSQLNKGIYIIEIINNKIRIYDKFVKL